VLYTTYCTGLYTTDYTVLSGYKGPSKMLFALNVFAQGKQNLAQVRAPLILYTTVLCCLCSKAETRIRLH